MNTTQKKVVMPTYRVLREITRIRKSRKNFIMISLDQVGDSGPMACLRVFEYQGPDAPPMATKSGFLTLLENVPHIISGLHKLLEEAVKLQAGPVNPPAPTAHEGDELPF